MSKTEATVAAKFEIPSFDDLAARLDDAKKMSASKRETLKLKKESILSQQVSQAKIAVIDAKANLEDALLSETKDAATAVKNLQSAQATYEFYVGVYNALFPNA